MKRRNRIRVKLPDLRPFALIGVRAELERLRTAPDRAMSGAEVQNEIVRLTFILATLEGTLSEATPTRKRKRSRTRKRQTRKRARRKRP